MASVVGRQCLHIKREEGGLALYDMEAQLSEGAVYQWEHSHLWTEAHSDNVQTLCANSTLYRNVEELSRLQEMLPSAEADIFRAKKEGRQSGEEQQRQRDIEF